MFPLLHCSGFIVTVALLVVDVVFPGTPIHDSCRLVEMDDDPELHVQSLCDMVTIYKELGNEELALYANSEIFTNLPN